jgi:hypothetical protein
MSVASCEPARAYFAHLAWGWQGAPAPFDAYFAAHPDRKFADEGNGTAHAILLAKFAAVVWAQLYSLLDGNGDHVITPAELASFDKDGDQALDVHELMGMLCALGFGVDDEVTDFARWVMSAAGDADGDGRLTLAEINAAVAAVPTEPRL